MQGYHARFIEGYVDEYDNDRLELFLDWDNDDRIEIEGSLETHCWNAIATATGRNFEIDVTDLSTEFIAGFKELVDNTKLVRHLILHRSQLLKVDNGTPPTLYIYHEDRGNYGYGRTLGLTITRMCSKLTT